MHWGTTYTPILYVLIKGKYNILIFECHLKNRSEIKGKVTHSQGQCPQSKTITSQKKEAEDHYHLYIQTQNLQKNASKQNSAMCKDCIQ